MHIHWNTQQVVEKRLKQAEDADKRKQFRAARKKAAEERGEEWVEDPRYYYDSNGVRRRRVRKWFGIWE
jgi:hypothetical protein